MSQYNIVLVAEESDFLELIKYKLQKKDFAVIQQSPTDFFVDDLHRHHPHAVVLCWDCSNYNAQEVCIQIRKNPDYWQLPILVFSKMHDVDTLVFALKSGADDYILAPFKSKELRARIKARLRPLQLHKEERIFTHHNVTLHPKTREVFVDGVPCSLSITEFNILHCLIKKPGRIYSREDLHDRCWKDHGDVSLRAVDIHILRLRQKLGWTEDSPIKTIRSQGYALFKQDD